METETKGTGAFLPPAFGRYGSGLHLDPADEGGGSVATADDVKAVAESVFGKDDAAEVKEGQQPGAAGSDGDRQEATGSQRQEAASATQGTWEANPLPAGHPLASKYKTLGDFYKGYQSSSAEARRLADEGIAYKRLFQAIRARGGLEGMQGAGAARPQAPQAGGAQVQSAAAAAAAAGVDGFPGFESLEAFALAYKNNPGGAMRKLVRGAILEDKELRSQLVDPVVEQKLAPERLRAETAQVRSVGEAFFAKHPEAGDPNNPISQAMESFMAKAGWTMPDPETGEHGLVRAARALAPYGLDPFTVAYNQVKATVTGAQLQTAEKRLVEKRAKAGTARPGSTFKGKPKNGTWEDSVANIAAEHGLGDEFVQAALTLGEKD